MKKVEFPLPKKQTGVFKDAAKQMGLEVFTSEYDGQDNHWIATIYVESYSELVTLGFIAGMEVMNCSVKNQMFDLSNTLEKVMSNFKQ